MHRRIRIAAALILLTGGSLAGIVAWTNHETSRPRTDEEIRSSVEAMGSTSEIVSYLETEFYRDERDRSILDVIAASGKRRFSADESRALVIGLAELTRGHGDLDSAERFAREEWRLQAPTLAGLEMGSGGFADPAAAGLIVTALERIPDGRRSEDERALLGWLRAESGEPVATDGGSAGANARAYAARTDQLAKRSVSLSVDPDEITEFGAAVAGSRWALDAGELPRALRLVVRARELSDGVLVQSTGELVKQGTEGRLATIVSEYETSRRALFDRSDLTSTELSETIADHAAAKIVLRSGSEVRSLRPEDLRTSLAEGSVTVTITEHEANATANGTLDRSDDRLDQNFRLEIQNTDGSSEKGKIRLVWRFRSGELKITEINLTEIERKSAPTSDTSSTQDEATPDETSSHAE